MRAIISEFKRKITRQVSWNLGSCLEKGAGEETERRPCVLNKVGIFNKGCGEHGAQKAAHTMGGVGESFRESEEAQSVKDNIRSWALGTMQKKEGKRGKHCAFLNQDSDKCVELTGIQSWYLCDCTAVRASWKQTCIVSFRA